MFSLYVESPWLVLQYLPNGDLKNYLIVSFIVNHSCEQLVSLVVTFFHFKEKRAQRGPTHQVHDRCCHGDALHHGERFSSQGELFTKQFHFGKQETV